MQHELLLYNDAECLVFPTQNMPSFVEKNATLVVYEPSDSTPVNAPEDKPVSPSSVSVSDLFDKY